MSLGGLDCGRRLLIVIVVGLLLISCSSTPSDPFDQAVDGYREAAESLASEGEALDSCRSTGSECAAEAIAMVDALAAVELPPQPNRAPNRMTVVDRLIVDFASQHESAARNMNRFRECGVSTCSDQVMELATQGNALANCLISSTDEDLTEECRTLVGFGSSTD